MRAASRSDYSPFAPLGWEIRSLSDNPALRDGALAISQKALQRAYPIKALRYWFIYHFLRVEFARRARALRVREVGIDQGQMLHFFRGANAIPNISGIPIERWTGVDCKVQHDALKMHRYDALIEANIEDSDTWIGNDDDIVIVLHVLEHLYAPEKVLEKIGLHARPGTAIVGGFPSLPQFLAPGRERKIRSNPNANGHVSAFSPTRVRTMAEDAGLMLEFLNGAFLLRASGLMLEDKAWWLRANLAFGACCPAWPGETYWVMRKP